ncbi:MAG TPA: NADP-dependent phosphogluconate dehydrogenase [Balneolaceae bacterium]|nr:NADP-dependent phosphogluconate dehydrogenase [Balneolaceae bacterium]
MEKEKFDIGMVGLGVMGRNFVLNIADHDYAVVGLDNDEDKASALEKEAGQQKVQGTTSPEAFISGLKKPRAVMMLVPAGKAVDSVIDELIPLLDEGDLIIDGGNSHFTDTNRHYTKLKEKNIHFMGVGISGGEKGARFGPSIMPGGSEKAYDRVQSIFEAAAAEVKGDPCVTWLGPGSAGHYVKMVHNGIEYGLMQLIAECYDIMKRGLGFDNDKLHQVFKKWNEAELSSFLMEITADIFAQPDDKSNGRLIDAILDSAKQKGTGKWASQDAMDLQVPIPTIDMAVAMRDISAYKEERAHASEVLQGPENHLDVDPDIFVGRLRNAMYFSMIAAYAQGMALLRAASDEYEYELNYQDIAKIWRGGCIIRADLLEEIRAAYVSNPTLTNLLIAPSLSDELKKCQADLRFVIGKASNAGIPAPALMASLGYYDSYRSKRLPANLIQAQRDNFGSHTYERTDIEGTFHTEWND